MSWDDTIWGFPRIEHSSPRMKTQQVMGGRLCTPHRLPRARGPWAGCRSVKCERRAGAPGHRGPGPTQTQACALSGGGSLSRAGEKLLCTGLLGTDVERREGRADPVKRDDTKQGLGRWRDKQLEEI